MAEIITNQVDIATIGIGSGNKCDGQVLVFYDLLGFDPKNELTFVKKYANAHEYLVNALKTYASDVIQAKFPLTSN